MSESKPKIYPIASDEVAKMFGFEVPENQSVSVSIPEDAKTSLGDLPVADLPIMKDENIPENNKPENETEEQGVLGSKETGTGELLARDLPDLEEKKSKRPLWVKLLKTAVPYAVVFAVAIILYLFFFGQINFGSVFSGSALKKVETPKESAISALAKENNEAYYAWISKFYYDVSDPEILDPLADNSGNGLSNFQKYLMNLNPRSYDTLGLGMADSEAIALGINPLTGKELSEKQKEILAQYFDMEVIANRLALVNLHNPKQVAGARVGPGPLRNPNYNYITDITDQAAQTGDAEMFNANALDINVDIPGRLEIPELGINVPIMWTKDPKDFDRDLQSGVVHYPGTALPGQIGTAYISGHSSNVAWAGGDFNQIFAKLNDLPDNTSFKVTVVQKDSDASAGAGGKDAILHYVVTHRREFSATDQEQFRNSGKSVIALSTCWPVGTTAKRLVVFAELTQVSK